MTTGSVPLVVADVVGMAEFLLQWLLCMEKWKFGSEIEGECGDGVGDGPG